MDDGFHVDVGEVHTHSSTVATLSTQVNNACGTAQGSMHGNAYGAIGAFFAAGLMMASDQVRDGILSAAKSFADVTKGLKAVADLYHEVDQRSAELMRMTSSGGDK